ncbi:hybrid sensor histidine kinase [Flagelloscypha sp. PMI_526]|nr:hybrid sensor histidine kinase [Flagelloscypha sp. PMI_526]
MTSLRRWRDDVQISMNRASAAEAGLNEKILKRSPSTGDETIALPPPVVGKSDQSPRRLRSSTSRIFGPLFARVRSHVRENLATPKSEMPPLQWRRYSSRRETSFEDVGVDEVVVDRQSWADDASSIKSDAHSCLSSEFARNATGVVHDPDRTIDDEPHCWFWSSCRPLSWVRWRVTPAVMDFFRTRFNVDDPNVEERYQKEVWTESKRPSLWASVFFIVNWILAMVFIPTPAVLPDQIFYYGVSALLTVPLLPMNIYDLPRRHSIIYQVFLLLSTWSWGLYQILFLFLCRDSEGTYTSALLVVALFGLHLKRFPAVIGSLVFLVVSMSLVKQQSWIRNTINTLVYDTIIIYMHYQREITQRRLFVLRLELNTQRDHAQRAMNKAQRAASSKTRLTGYIFHEVRVPLNTALLAVQNLEATGAISKQHNVEFHGLRGSLSMMSKGMEHNLHFHFCNRMDSGRFESAPKMATDARQLKLETDLDPQIDNIARRAEYEALGELPHIAEQLISQNPSGPDHRGIVLGDETRLRQIVTNLASNAVKFTLVHPRLDNLKGDSPKPKTADSSESKTMTLSEDLLTRHEFDVASSVIDKIVVRVEVSDTGSGIKSSDLTDGKLFSAFNQTEQGRLQGGKGTGLGLALVRQIVRLSHGRLGVKSTTGPNSGSTFWFEIPLGVGQKIIEYSGPEQPGTAGPVSPNLHVGEFFQEAADAAKVVAAPLDTSTPRTSLVIERRSSRPNRPLRAPSAISTSALHGLMDQGGSFELTLPGYESHSTVPTRTLGDVSTGTEFNIAPPTPTALHHTVSPSLKGSPQTSPEQERLHGFFDEQGSLPPTPGYEATSSLGHHSSSQHSHSNSLDRPALHVLVVDDDSLTRTLMRRMLERLGCHVTTADNGAKALSLILGVSEGPLESLLQKDKEPQTSVYGASPFNLVFLDNQMPVCSGLQAARTLRSLGRTDLVVGVTGNALLGDQQVTLDVLIKPVLEKSIKSMMALAHERLKAELQTSS